MTKQFKKPFSSTAIVLTGLMLAFAGVSGCSENEQEIVAAAPVDSSGAQKQIEPMEPDPAMVERGKELSFNRSKGNCLACHVIEDGEFPGNIGPPLIMMSARYPERSLLRDQIADATVGNPDTVMPPFGKNSILTDDELDAVTEYIWTL